MPVRRPYASTVRAERAAETRERIRQASIGLHAERLWDDFTLEEVATRAGTTVQTVLRVYGSKDALTTLAVEASSAPRREPCKTGDVRDAMRVLYDDYDRVGDRIIRYIADEHRNPVLARRVALGRKGHRAWTQSAFAPQLRACPSRSRARLLQALLVATDVYVWKVLRRDLGLERRKAENIVLDIVSGILSRDTHGEIPVGVLGRRREPATKPRHRARAARSTS